MAKKRVFFSFHYKDVAEFRANVVRNHWVTKEGEEAGYFDSSLWESTKTRGDEALKRLINDGLNGTSATCALIGSETYARPWVRYEILKSMKRGNKLLGIHINGISDRNGQTKDLGPNLFDFLAVRYSLDGRTLTMLEAVNGQWAEYTKVDGSPSYSIDQRPEGDRGKLFALSHFYPTYLWIKDKGYDNFDSWVGN
jgi:hypothetical protein